MQEKRSQFKLCVSISAGSVELLSEKSKKAWKYGPEFLEFRLDYIKSLDTDKLKRISQLLHGNEILTIRSRLEGGSSQLSERNRLLLVRKGLQCMRGKFIDVEISTLNKHPKILHDIQESETKLIASYHDSNGRKDFDELRRTVSLAPIRSKSLFAIKIVSEAKKKEDNQKILKLYSEKPFKDKNSPKLVAFCTGKLGVDSRIECLFKGSPFSYCSLPGEPLASGQLDIETMRKAIARRESLV